MSITKKLIVLGLIALSAILVLGVLASYETSKTIKANDANTAMARQMEIIDSLAYARTEIVLVAMDMIVDKDSGEIEPERMKIIQEAADLLRGGVADLEGIFSQGEGAQLVTEYRDNIGPFVKAITDELPALVRRKAPDEQFHGIDDAIDGRGGVLEEVLARMDSLVLEKQQTANSEFIEHLSSTGTFINIVAVCSFLVVAAGFLLLGRSIVNAMLEVVGKLEVSAGHAADSALQLSSASQSLADGSSQQAAALEQISQ